MIGTSYRPKGLTYSKGLRTAPKTLADLPKSVGRPFALKSPVFEKQCSLINYILNSWGDGTRPYTKKQAETGMLDHYNLLAFVQ